MDKIRRFPHLTRGDAAALRLMTPGAAREFERLLQQQHDSDRRHHDRTQGVEPDELERAAGRRRYGDGSGGGRRAPRHATA